MKPLTLWKFQSRPEVCHTLLVLRQTTVRLRMIRLIEMHSSKQYTNIPSPDESSTFKKPGHNSCARSSTWLNGSHCGQRSSNSNSQPREVTPNGVTMHQISVGCVGKKTGEHFRAPVCQESKIHRPSLSMQASHIPLLPA